MQIKVKKTKRKSDGWYEYICIYKDMVLGVATKDISKKGDIRTLDSIKNSLNLFQYLGNDRGKFHDCINDIDILNKNSNMMFFEMNKKTYTPLETFDLVLEKK